MKLIYAFAVVLLPMQLWGQDSVKIKNNAIGLFAEGDDARAGNVSNVSSYGVNYRRAKNVFFSWHVALGVGNAYGETQIGRPAYVHRDTTRTWLLRTNAPMAMVSGGVEVQRRFYRKVYLFAGGDLRIVGGTGNYDTVLRTDYRRYSLNPTTGEVTATWTQTDKIWQGPDVMIMQASLVPYIGVKLALGRFDVGLRYGTFIKSHSEKVNGNSVALGSFESGIHYRRFFVMYRF